ncbi:CinA family protein [Isoalcanivorax beigongshangi]|uniref:CinA family protein n=1 Tax=Isoalcanivorax beigongshangi TaxID=3238810 RepID=A0ABV4AHV6_9GAMM
MEQARQVGIALAARGWMMTTAESCTGGGIAAAITDIPGSSAWFDRGFVTYSNDAKQALLGVAATTLATHGAVSEAVVLEMAEGARKASGAQCAVSVSGIAGPDGGSAGKPVGTVWLAWAFEGRPSEAQRFRFAGDRAAVRAAAVQAALAGVLARLSTA